METVVEALEAVELAFSDQIAAGAEAAVNTAVDGDAAARRMFNGLLPPEMQRRVFLKYAKRRAFWPRIRTLVGIPPFAFLRAEDEGVLRAGGIGKGRAHMVGGRSSFVAHFTDENERSFQAVAGKAEQGLLLFVGLVRGAETVLEVRLKRRSNAERQRLLRDGEKDRITPPQPGTALTLFPNALTREAASTVEVTVLRLQKTGTGTRILVKTSG